MSTPSECQRICNVNDVFSGINSCIPTERESKKLSQIVSSNFILLRKSKIEEVDINKIF